eukprot:3876080-Ditylum_brightwellii.AAC.1
MYIVLCRSFACQSKTAMQSVADDNEQDDELDFNVNILGTRKCHIATRGDDKEASLKLYKALVSTSVDAFSSGIRAYKAAIAVKDKKLNFTKLADIAKAKYTSLKIHD